MANVKTVIIQGYMHFGVQSFGTDDDVFCPRHEEVMRILGTLNIPTFGLRISYSGITVQIPNKFNGRTTFCQYSITGQEAIHSDVLQNWVDALSEVGVVAHAAVSDAENSQPIPVRVTYHPAALSLIEEISNSYGAGSK